MPTEYAQWLSGLVGLDINLGIGFADELNGYLDKLRTTGALTDEELDRIEHINDIIWGAE